MINSQATKKVIVTAPGVIVDNASWTCTAIDTKGYDYVDIDVIIGGLDISIAALKLTESDDDSSYSDVTGGDFSVSGTLPADTADNTIVGWHVNCGANGARKRYLKPVATGGNGAAGTYLAITAELSRPEQAPDSASDRGLGQELFV